MLGGLGVYRLIMLALEWFGLDGLKFFGLALALQVRRGISKSKANALSAAHFGVFALNQALGLVAGPVVQTRQQLGTAAPQFMLVLVISKFFERVLSARLLAELLQLRAFNRQIARNCLVGQKLGRDPLRHPRMVLYLAGSHVVDWPASLRTERTPGCFLQQGQQVFSHVNGLHLRQNCVGPIFRLLRVDSQFALFPGNARGRS